MPAIGSDAPDFSLHDNAKRELVKLSEQRGKNVVLLFFPAAFAGPCTAEMCTFRDSLSQFNELDATLLGVSVDGPLSNDAFAKKNELNFPLLSDYTRATVRAYDVAHDDFLGMIGYTAAKRSVFVVDKEGKIRYAWIADNPGQEPNYDEVQAVVRAL